jgi:hypothetical protein
VTGSTQSPGWLSGGWDTTHNGNTDGFVLKIVQPFVQPLQITENPMGADLYVGATFDAMVAASGFYTPLAYQWTRGGTDIPTATDTAFTIAAVSLSDAGAYACRVTDDVGATVTSEDAVLQVADHLAITTQPVGADLGLGDPYTLFVETAGGFLPLTYQWIKNGTDIPDATESSYEITSFAGTDVGAYTVVVHDNLTDDDTSAPVLLQLIGGLPVAGLAGLAAAVLAAGFLGVRRLRQRTK